MMRALALIGGLVLWATTAWAGPPSAEQAPGPVQAAWEYPPEEEFLLGNHPPSGFIFYRGLGAECSHFMLIGLPVARPPISAREAVDASIPSDFSGEVCYELTAYITIGDPNLGTQRVSESTRTNRIGWHRLAAPSWWGDTVLVDY